MLLIWLDFPSSADWAIGLLVGIDLLFAGWILLTVSSAGKQLAAGSPNAAGYLCRGRMTKAPPPHSAGIGADRLRSR